MGASEEANIYFGKFPKLIYFLFSLWHDSNWRKLWMKIQTNQRNMKERLFWWQICKPKNLIIAVTTGNDTHYVIQ